MPKKLKTHMIDPYFDHNAYLKDNEFMSKCGRVLPQERFAVEDPTKVTNPIRPDWCGQCSPEQRVLKKIGRRYVAREQVCHNF